MDPSDQCRVYPGFKWMLPRGEKFHQDILQLGLKINIWWGNSRIWVLVVGFLQIGALKKHAPLVLAQIVLGKESVYYQICTRRKEKVIQISKNGL